jgi:hypothetical protein
VRDQIQAVATKYRTENVALGEQITRLHTEKARLESKSGKIESVEKNPGSVSEQYEKPPGSAVFVKLIMKSRRNRERSTRTRMK